LKSKAIFLDRDGVLNKAIVRNGKPYPPANLAEFEILPDVKEALLQLKAAGYLLIVVTNQPDVGRGAQQQSVVDAMHDLLQRELPLDAIYVCYHGYDGECECRKPKPGMLIEAAKKYDIDLRQSYIVGDRSKDVDAGLAGGCCTVFIDYGYCEPLNTSPDFTTDTLQSAATWILLQDPI
jgi:D-glycero-D-manno-heptose 1,7-bisphosphate phosphatase